jgi:hypothetical protein
MLVTAVSPLGRNPMLRLKRMLGVVAAVGAVAGAGKEW